MSAWLHRHWVWLPQFVLVFFPLWGVCVYLPLPCPILPYFLETGSFTELRAHCFSGQNGSQQSLEILSSRLPQLWVYRCAWPHQLWEQCPAMWSVLCPGKLWGRQSNYLKVVKPGGISEVGCLSNRRAEVSSGRANVDSRLGKRGRVIRLITKASLTCAFLKIFVPGLKGSRLV